MVLTRLPSPFSVQWLSFESLIHLELLRRLQLLQLPNCEASQARAHAKWLSMPMRDTRHHEAQQLGTLYTERHHLADLAVRGICSEWPEQNASLKKASWVRLPGWEITYSSCTEKAPFMTNHCWLVYLEVYTTVLTWNEWTRCQNYLVSLSNPRAYIPTSNCPKWAWTKCFRIDTANKTVVTFSRSLMRPCHKEWGMAGMGEWSKRTEIETRCWNMMTKTAMFESMPNIAQCLPPRFEWSQMHCHRPILPSHQKNKALWKNRVAVYEFYWRELHSSTSPWQHFGLN